jgi:hypothetical protein
MLYDATSGGAGRQPGKLSSPGSAILQATLSQLVLARLNACPGSVASQTAGCGAVGTNAAIALGDHDLSILDSGIAGS